MTGPYPVEDFNPVTKQFERTAPHAEGDRPAQAPYEPKCDHICLKDDGHVERGEPHFYGYENRSPRNVRLIQEARELLANVDDWGHPWSHNAYMAEVNAWLQRADAVPRPMAERALRYCARCAGTGEFPPTGGVTCSWCNGEGEYPEPLDGPGDVS